jgi:hypothetical protein
MNGDEGVGNTPCTFCSICIPDHGMCKQSFTDLILVTVNVQFALFTVNEFRRACSNCEFLGEILNMY